MSRETMEAVANAATIFRKNHGKLDQLRDAIAAHDADEAAQAAPEPAAPKKRASRAKAAT